jgi:2-keto-4-pentenoate hydratase/2-oxohepta-3-ene-1,7-dioic acid hydratase in catechol pathway
MPAEESSVKLAYFDDYRIGVEKNDGIVEVSEQLAEIPRLSGRDLMVPLIESFDRYRERLEKAAGSGNVIPLAQVRLRPPLPNPRTIVCMAVNYDDGMIKSAHTNAFHRQAQSSVTTTS